MESFVGRPGHESSRRIEEGFADVGLYPMICLLPLLLTVYDEYRAYLDFPVPADFASALDLSRWRGTDNFTRTGAPVKNGRFALN